METRTFYIQKYCPTLSDTNHSVLFKLFKTIRSTHACLVKFFKLYEMYLLY